MQNLLTAIVSEAKQGADALLSRPDFDTFKARFVGPKGALTSAMKQMGSVPKEEKPMMGRLINEAKQSLEAIFAQTLERIEAQEMQAKLGPAIDPTLPTTAGPVGTRHLISQVRHTVCEVFRKIGFSVAEGQEVESEWFCFDALNHPENHPARAEQDTYYMPDDASFAGLKKKGDERLLLRTHTSTVQIRTMLAEEPPLRIIAPGRCFRRDTADATHSANFHQLEVLCVDKDVTVRDLKAALDFFVQELFGKGAKTRLRPSFFPFTEPSFEMDFMSPNMGKLSNQWIEIMGCGMVDPEVFKSAGYDPSVWQGYAAGMGIERIAMLLHGVDDIRNFYQNDVRFLRQFS